MLHLVKQYMSLWVVSQDNQQQLNMVLAGMGELVLIMVVLVVVWLQERLVVLLLVELAQQ